MRAIDVSSYQGKPDWGEVKKDGVSAAILRIANRKGKDESFDHNYSGCEAAGIKRGVYRYSYAKNPAEAIREAIGVLDILNGRTLELGVWLDLEWKEQRNLGKNPITVIALAFIKTIEAAGYKCGIYCNMDWHKNVLDLEKLDVPFWIARYPSDDSGILRPQLKPNKGECGWQYSSKGKINGIEGHVDLDEWYGSPDMFGSGSRNIDREAVRSLQEAMSADGIKDKNGKDLQIDGKKGPLTESAIAKILMKSGAFDTAHGKYTVGSTGQVVKWLEMRLDSLIGDSIKELLDHNLTNGAEADGKYGADVRLAVGLFQEMRGLDIDYKAGPKTVTELLFN